MDELYHHGIKGQRWGIRRYQYQDGTYTPLGKRRLRGSGSSREYDRALRKTERTGIDYVNRRFDKGQTFNRITLSKKSPKHAFYATYLKDDSDKYAGLFGPNLQSRARKEAEARGESVSNAKVYQLSIKAAKRLSIPSEENVADIIGGMLTDSTFKRNVAKSIEDSRSKMRRGVQQLIFKQAQNALSIDPSQLTDRDKKAIAKAFNLTLTNHNSYEVDAQNAFYSELKRKGYNALLDYNDKVYSSYHAKRPMIIFDVDGVTVDAIRELDPKVAARLNRKYTVEQALKNIPATTVGWVAKFGQKTYDEAMSSLDRLRIKYLEHKK